MESPDTNYIVYGKDKLNDVVGETDWVTITPEQDQEVSGLYSDPYKAAMVGHALGKDFAFLGIAGTTLAVLAHSFWWKYIAPDDDGHGKTNIPRGQVRYRHEHDPEHEKTQAHLASAQSSAHKQYDKPDALHTILRGEPGGRDEK